MKNVKIIKSIIISVVFLSVFVSCKNQKEYKKVDIAGTTFINNGKELMVQKCNICHSTSSESHDKIIAPPMVAVKRRYSRAYYSEKEFVEAVTNWVLNPNEQEAIMYGAVQQYKVMPKLPYTKEEITTIAKYIYNNELDKPSWFQQHFNEEHQNGKSRGKRMRNGRGNQF